MEKTANVPERHSSKVLGALAGGLASEASSFSAHCNCHSLALGSSAEAMKKAMHSILVILMLKNYQVSTFKKSVKKMK